MTTRAPAVLKINTKRVGNIHKNRIENIDTNRRGEIKEISA